ncbi:MAG: methionine synthase [Micromonosporaceae bacterium]
MSAPGWPWPAGAATGIGSLPGTDVVEAVKTVFGELPEFPYLPELPARGPGADAIGRTAALLVDLPVELYAARWRVAGRPGRDLRRAHDLRERDLDTLTEEAAEFAGPVKAQAVGPWTLAAALDLPYGGPVLRDPGAVRDLAASLAEGLRAHVAELRARLPRASPVLQLDEPSLPAVLAGQVPTESGFGTLPAVEPGVAVGALRSVVAAVGVPVVVHCCAAGVPLRSLRDTGAAAVAVDLDLLDDFDALGEVLDDGLGLFAGAVSTAPTAPPAYPSSADIASRVRRLWRDLGLPLDRMPAQVVVTSACGLAGATAGQARAVQAACREAGRRLAEEPEAG